MNAAKPPEGAPSRATLSAEAQDFAPGLLSIQESPPARLPRAVFYAVSALFAILLLWACFGKLDIITSADGRLVPQSYVKVVQPADAGIVKEILVREGESVRAGQVLLRMDPVDAEADTQTVKTEMAFRSLQVKRIEAELNGKPLKRDAGDPADLFTQVNAQYRERRQAYADNLAQAQETLSRARHEVESGVQVLSKLKQTNPILKSQAQAYADLGQDGYAPKMTIGDKQRAYLENEQDLHAQEATVQGLQSAVLAAEKQVSQVTSKYRSDLENERVEAGGEYRKLEQAWAKQAHKTALLELKAPVAGIVKDLSIHTLGTVVSVGSVLCSLVPEHEPLLAEVMIKNDDVGFVHLQQKVKLKLSAYPFQKYGLLDGRVQQIWPDANDNETQSRSKNSTSDSNPDSDPSPLAYKALIALDRQDLVAEGQTFQLVPGMRVMAEVHQGRRTVLEYLLSPVRKTLSESARER